MKKPQTQIEYRKLSDLMKLENNPRYIRVEDMERLEASIQKLPNYFEAHAIVLSDRTGQLVVIDGNQRMQAALNLGLKEVPTVLLHGLTEAQEREIIIRANVTNGKWDWDTLANCGWEVEELQDWGLECSFMNVEEEPTDIDSLFEDAENAEQKQKDFKIEVLVAPEQEEMLDAIKESISAALTEYEGITIK